MSTESRDTGAIVTGLRAVAQRVHVVFDSPPDLENLRRELRESLGREWFQPESAPVPIGLCKQAKLAWLVTIHDEMMAADQAQSILTLQELDPNQLIWAPPYPGDDRDRNVSTNILSFQGELVHKVTLADLSTLEGFLDDFAWFRKNGEPGRALTTPNGKPGTGEQRRSGKRHGNTLKKDAKKELVLAYCKDTRWNGTLIELKAALQRDKGLPVSTTTLHRYLAGSRFATDPRHKAGGPGIRRGRNEREAIDVTEAVDLSSLGAYTMPDED